MISKMKTKYIQNYILQTYRSMPVVDSLLQCPLNPARAEDLCRPHQVHFLRDNRFVVELF